MGVKLVVRALVLVLGMSLHLVSIVVVCIVLGEYLDGRWPLASVSWLAVTFIVGIIIIIQNYYVFFKFVLKQEKVHRDR